MGACLLSRYPLLDSIKILTALTFISIFLVLQVLRGLKRMKMKSVASVAFLLNTFLFGSYYSVAKEVLGHVDPIVFTFFTMMTLVPPALCIIACSWRNMTREAVKSGFLLGSCLCLGLFTLSVALKYNSATGTAFLPSLNGLLAAVFTWFFLRQRIAKVTWFAGLVSVAGAVLLLMNASMGGLRGVLIAFIGGLLCTFYVFLSEREQKDPSIYWPLFGVELLTMALWANLIVLLFGNWQLASFALPKDVWVVLYIGLGTIFLPTLISLLLQKHISSMTVSFIYILEPILGAVIANLYLHEVLPLDGYIGGGLIFAGVVIHTWGTLERPVSNHFALRQRLTLTGQRLQSSLPGMLFYPLLCCGIGIFVVYKLGGFPPLVWLELYAMGPQIHNLIQQGHGMDVLLLVAQSLSWLIAWVSIIVMGCLASYNVVEKIFFPPRSIQVDTRSLRQMGYTPYSSSSARHKVDTPLVQRRRRQRRERLIQQEVREHTYVSRTPLASSFHASAGLMFSDAGAHRSLKTRLVALSKDEMNEDDIPTSPYIDMSVFSAPVREQVRSRGREHFSDGSGNHWAYWDDLEGTEVSEL
jgi:drug/metabolite transporter (DMT)-like permease